MHGNNTEIIAGSKTCEMSVNTHFASGALDHSATDCYRQSGGDWKESISAV